MTPRQQQMQNMYAILKKIDALFEYQEEITAFIGKISKSDEDSSRYLENYKKDSISFDEQIEGFESEYADWQLRFQADPVLKQSYIKLGERLKAYIDKYDPPKYRTFYKRIDKAGILKPFIEPLQVKRLSFIKEDEIEDYRIEIEYQFLAREAMYDREWISKLKELKVELFNAVANAKALEEEYDDFLTNKIIVEHLDNTDEKADVFNIPYNKLSSFNERTKHYLK